jgi:hypothetical protein
MTDANGVPFRKVNDQKLCIPEQSVLEKCARYNLSGTACDLCLEDAKNLEASGCRLPPNCSSIDPITLTC